MNEPQIKDMPIIQVGLSINEAQKLAHILSTYSASALVGDVTTEFAEQFGAGLQQMIRRAPTAIEIIEQQLQHDDEVAAMGFNVVVQPKEEANPLCGPDGTRIAGE